MFGVALSWTLLACFPTVCSAVKAGDNNSTEQEPEIYPQNMYRKDRDGRRRDADEDGVLERLISRSKVVINHGIVEVGGCGE